MEVAAAKLRPFFVRKDNVCCKRWWKISSDGYYHIALHHKHMKHIKFFKPFTPHVIAWSARKGFWSVDWTKEQKRRLQYSACAMPKSVMPSAAKKRKVTQAKKPGIWQWYLKHRDWNFKLQRWNSGVNQSTWKCRWKTRHKSRSTFRIRPGWPFDILFFRCVCLQSLVSAYCSDECCFLPSHSLAKAQPGGVLKGLKHPP